MHPDLIKGEDKNIFDNYDPQYDMWSFGVVLYMLVYDRHPFAEDDRFSPQRLAKYQTNPK